MNTLKEIAHYIKSNDNFLIISHEHPDGDNIGSQLALAIFLKKKKKNFYIYNHDEVPEFLNFLPFSELIKTSLPIGFKVENVIMVDTGDISRTGKVAGFVEEILKCKDIKLILLDHHPVTKTNRADLMYVNPSASSTGEIIYNLLKILKAKITKEIAINLYTAILTDTGSFKQANTTSDTFLVVSQLVKAGAKPSEIASKIYDTFNLKVLKLTAYMLSKIRTNQKGNVAYSYITRDMFKKAGATDEHTEGLINYIRSLAGVKVAVLFREVEKDKIKVTFRSKESINILPVVQKFGGGGHPNAAGVLMKGKLGYIKRKVLKEVYRVFGK